MTTPASRNCSPCPFCAATWEAGGLGISYRGQPAEGWYVRCTRCQAAGPYVDGGHTDSIPLAIDLWNKSNAPLSERGQRGAMAADARRYHWLLDKQSFGKQDNPKNDWLELSGYMNAAESLNGGWLVRKEHIDKYIDAHIAASDDKPESVAVPRATLKSWLEWTRNRVPSRDRENIDCMAQEMEAALSALPELGRSREDVYRRGFTLTLAAALAGGWLEEDKEMRNKVIAYLGTAPLDGPDQTCEKILNDALGIPTDADRAFVSTTGTIQAGQSNIASTIVVGGQHILSQPHPAPNASEPAVPNGHYAEIRFGGAAWIPMKDRQPADFQTVLCVNSNHWMAVANRFYKDHAGRWNASHVAAEDMHDDLIIGEITHWRELPDAPALSAIGQPK